MTEQEYIDVSDLIKIRIAKEVLRDIIPKNSSVVNEFESGLMIKKLSELEERLFFKIKINE